MVLLVGAGVVSAVRARSTSLDSSTALTVNGWTLSNDDFDDQVRQLSRNPAYLEARKAANGGQALQVYQSGTDQVDPDLAAELLNERISFRLVADELRVRGITPTDADRARVAELLGASLGQGSIAGGDRPPGTAPPASTPSGTVPGGPLSTTDARKLGTAVLDGFGSYRQVFLDGLSGVIALQRVLSGDVESEAGQRALYEQNKDRLQVACVTHVLARAGNAQPDPTTGQTPVPTDAEYAAAYDKIVALRSRVAAGAPLADVARSDSDDPATREDGGDLRCRTKGTYAEAFDDAVWTQPVGAVGEPVKSPFGWHLIQVRERRLPPFEEIRDQLVSAARQKAGDAFQQWLDGAAKQATVSVDPRYGRWDASRGAVLPAPVGRGGLQPVDPGSSVVPPGPTSTR